MNTQRRIRVYVAGAMTPTGHGNHAIEFLNNIRAGIKASIRLIKLGFTPVCPMLDFQYFLCAAPYEQINAGEIYDVSISLMLGCDVILLLPGAENSTGWKNEKEVADAEGIQVYYTHEELLFERAPGRINCQKV